MKLAHLFTGALTAIVLTVFGDPAAFAQTYPSRPVHIIATEAGSVLDLYARRIAQEIMGPLGQPVVVENRQTALLPQVLAQAAPDGYTIALTGGAVWLTPLIQKVTYDAERDFAPITLATVYPHVLVAQKSLNVSSVKNLVALAKAKPGTLNISAVSTPGGQTFLSVELFKSLADVNIVRVPYTGNAPGFNALLAGEVNLMFIDYGTAAGHIGDDGKLRALAVTSLKPFALLPNLPTMSDAGVPGYESLVLSGFIAPTKTPAAVIDRLNSEIVKALNQPGLKKALLDVGVETLPSTPAEFGARIRTEIVKWGKVLKDAGVTAQ